MQKETQSDIYEINWVNQAHESGLPYDFLVKLKDPQTGELTEMYIEVKATKSNQKALFEISSQEIKFAQEMKENFHLYRVFNAGDMNAVRLSRLENLAQKLYEQKVKLFLAV